MNSIKLFYLFLLIMLWAVNSDLLKAQDGSESDASFVLNTPYFINRMSPGMEWTVQQDLHPSSQADSAVSTNSDNKPSQKVITVKTTKFVLRRDYKNDGSLWDTWCVGDCQVLLWPDHKQWIVNKARTDASIPNVNYVDYSRSDFPELAWINAGAFVGLDNYKGVKCLKFKGSYTFPTDDAPTELIAFINKDTRYPVALVRPEGTFIYSFDSNIAMEEEPDIVKKLLAKIDSQNQAVRVAPISQ